MIGYEKFARFYDTVMGDRAHSAAEVHKLIRRHHPRAKTLLELACGTGAVLKGLKQSYRVAGLDLSPAMLQIARKKFPKVHLYRASMTKFALKERFDVVICVFDSINHLTKFADWKRVFACAHRHLNPGGIFIFDVNTPSKLMKFDKEPAWVSQLGRDLMIMNVTCDKHALSKWDIKVFEYQGGERFRLHHEIIKEQAYPAEKIVKALREVFSTVSVVDLKRKRATADSDRLHFICKA